ncbi:penicillin-binding protein 2 [bacterium]|jgi:cell division protein FtsI/penicillin-binding protein 2|nr:penicillin-binding protein 2 [bacterium]MBT6831956.1 penicillin-binding protein 2 [bacterium]MBT6996652.1 penicillin-binding protein 2 [bacterium]MBT7773072.1 penicillin-binding protein 2 [bacterium]
MYDFSQRIKFLKIFFAVIFLIFAVRLVDLQLIRHDEFAAEANAQHLKKSIIPARRGKILVRKNYFSDELTPLATNHTMQMLFADPLVLAYPKYNPKLPLEKQDRGNPALAAKILAPLLVNSHCDKIDGCAIKPDESQWNAVERKIVETYEQELRKILEEAERRRVVLMTDVNDLRTAEIGLLQLPGISVKNATLIADPVKIFDVTRTAEQLAPLIGVSQNQLELWISRRPKRYVEITHKIVPELSQKIAALKSDPASRDVLRGIQLRDEYWRFYPEKSLGAQVLGFVDNQGSGQYGIEGRFDLDLRGESGIISGATSVSGQQILGKDLGIQQARDGSDLVLSIDRIIQGEVEKILAEDTQKYEADFGQVIVVEPKTGKILAMVHSPTFDPNNFGDVFTKFEIPAEQEEMDRADENFKQRIPTIATATGQFFRYFNLWGPTVFRNKIVSDEYEPGSVIKAFTMSAALNTDEITPQTTFEDIGPVEVDEFEIKNSDGEYHGTTTMIELLDRSLNTGIAFVTQKMGAKMLYEYFENFGFAQYTDIQIDGEARGQLEHWKNWEASELVTRGFGQGISSSPLQVAMAFSSLANGGYLMKPLLVEKIIEPNGDEEIFEPERVRRVISEETYQTIKAMLLSAVENGTGRGARVFGHSVMGKTGTSQTYRHGEALTGEGTTIASFAGFGPFDNPRFVVLVKYDYPEYSPWGSETAAITFRRVSTFLFDYFKIPPEK